MSPPLVLVSGGLDSTVCLALALHEAGAASAVSFDYGQRHGVELQCAAGIASAYGVEHVLVPIDLSAGGARL